MTAHATSPTIDGGGGGEAEGSPPPLNYHKNIGFLSNTGPDPLKITKLPSHSPVPVSKRPFQWHFAGGPMMARFKCCLGSLSPHQKGKKRCQSWTPSGKTLWIHAWLLK